MSGNVCTSEQKEQMYADITKFAAQCEVRRGRLTPKSMCKSCDRVVCLPKSTKIDLFVTVDHLFPATLVEGKAVSTTVEVLYQRESIELDDKYNYTVHVPSRLDKLPDTLCFALDLELWHITKEAMLNSGKGCVEFVGFQMKLAL